MRAAARDLPSDDPLRGAEDQVPVAQNPPLASDRDRKSTTGPSTGVPSTAPVQTSTAARSTVPVNSARIPALTGLTVRKAIEQAAAAGFDVRIEGNGQVREQIPAGGAAAEPGTVILLRCGR